MGGDTLRQVAGRAFGRVVALGGVVGASVGLVIGLAAYWPTSPAAMVEGGALGAAAAVPLGVVTFLCVLAVRSVHR